MTPISIRLFPATLLLSILLTSCATWERTFFSEDLKTISLGDEKSVVIEKLGGVATPIGSEVVDGITYEVLEFVEKPFYMGRASKTHWTPYWAHFRDNKLIKYERAPKSEPPPQSDDAAALAAMGTMMGGMAQMQQANQMQQNDALLGSLVTGGGSQNVRVQTSCYTVGGHTYCN